MAMRSWLLCATVAVALARGLPEPTGTQTGRRICLRGQGGTRGTTKARTAWSKRRKGGTKGTPELPDRMGPMEWTGAGDRIREQPDRRGDGTCGATGATDGPAGATGPAGSKGDKGIAAILDRRGPTGPAGSAAYAEDVASFAGYTTGTTTARSQTVGTECMRCARRPFRFAPVSQQ